MEFLTKDQLEKLGIKLPPFPITSVGQAVQNLAQLPNAQKTGAHGSTTDPLKKQNRGEKPLHMQDGAELEDLLNQPVTIQEVEEVLQEVVPTRAGPRRSSPVTPD